MNAQEVRYRLVVEDFRLVGSRATGLNRENADWDFAGKYSRRSKAVLKELGFTEAKVPEMALDDLTMAVYQRRMLGAIIQVCLVSNLRVKLKAMQALKFNPELAKLDRSLRGGKTMAQRRERRRTRRCFWNTLFWLAEYR